MSNKTGSILTSYGNIVMAYNTELTFDKLLNNSKLSLQKEEEGG